MFAITNCVRRGRPRAWLLPVLLTMSIATVVWLALLARPLVPPVSAATALKLPPPDSSPGLAVACCSELSLNTLAIAGVSGEAASNLLVAVVSAQVDMASVAAALEEHSLAR